jgi:hypothetical protein
MRTVSWTARSPFLQTSQSSKKQEDEIDLAPSASCRGRTLGVITFVSAESGRRFDATDLAFAEELASIASLAVDNARLYVKRRTRIVPKTIF